MKSKITKLYFALDAFRKTKEFHFYGFGKGGPFSFFVHDVKNIKFSNPDTKTMEAVLDLEQLAFRYAVKRGRKDKVTKFLSRKTLEYLGVRLRPWWKIFLKI